MTFAELLSAITVASIVLTAAIMLVVMSMRFSLRVSDKVNAAAVSRNSMEQVQQRLGSQTCMYFGEYTVNGGDPDTATGQSSIVFAGPTEAVFFADLGTGGGATNVVGSVGFVPQMRFLWFTNGGADGRQTRLLDGYRNSTSTSSPYNFNISPSSASNFDGLSTTSGLGNVTPATVKALASGVTQAVSGATSVPYFQYLDNDGNPVAYVGGSIPTESTGDIATIRVSYKVLGLSGKDEGYKAGSKIVDDRTATVQSDIPMRVSPAGCT